MSAALSVHVLCGVIVAAALSAPADDVHREATSITGLRWKAPPALARAGTVGVSEESAAEYIGELSLADVSALGLQRSVTVRKRPKAVSSEVPEHVGVAGVSKDIALPPADGSVPEDVGKLSFADVSVLGLQRSAVVRKRPKASEELEHVGAVGISKDIALSPTDGRAAADAGELSLADVSLLGFQRSAIVRKRPKAVSSQELEHARAVGVSQEIALPLTDGSAAEDVGKLSLADVSVLGLQRSAVVRKRPKAVSSEKLEQAGAVGVSMDIALRLADGSAAEDVGKLSLADVSVLGLQRSAIVRKRPKANSDISWPLEEELVEAAPGGVSLADVSLLGLQRSAKIVRRQRAKASPSVAGGERGANIGSSSGRTSVSVPGGFMSKAPRASAEKLG